MDGVYLSVFRKWQHRCLQLFQSSRLFKKKMFLGHESSHPDSAVSKGKTNYTQKAPISFHQPFHQRKKTRPHADNLQQRCLNLYIWISNNFHLIHNLYSSHSSAKLPCIVHCRERLWSCPPRNPLLCMTLMKTCLQSLDCHQSLTHRSSPGIRLDTCKACQTNEDPFLTIHTKWAFNIARGSRRWERELVHIYCLLPHLLYHRYIKNMKQKWSCYTWDLGTSQDFFL